MSACSTSLPSNIDWLTNDKWEIAAGSFSPDGRSLCWTANVDGNTNIYVYDLASKQTQTLPLSAGVNTLGRQSPALFPRRIEAALLPQRPRLLPTTPGPTTSRRKSSRSR